MAVRVRGDVGRRKGTTQIKGVCHISELPAAACDPEKFLFEYWEEPQACDMDVLKCVSDLVEEFDLFDNAEMSRKYFEECADQWKNWYASMDPAFGEPDVMNFYEEKYKRFQRYSDPSNYDRLYGMDVVTDFGEDEICAGYGNLID